MVLRPVLTLAFICAFAGGLLGNDFTAEVLVAFGTFIAACGCGGKWWVWFVLPVTAWAVGSAVLMLLRLGNAELPGTPDELDTILTVIVALFTAVAGTALNLAASRIIRPK